MAFWLLTFRSLYPTGSPPLQEPIVCGVWARANVFEARPEAVVLDLASLIWPIREVSQLLRFLAARHAMPVSVCGGEFTAASS